MPAYLITAPDGRKFRVTAPDGASQEQVLAYAQENFKPKQNLKESNPAEYDPGSAAFKGKYGPASGGVLENILAAGGKFFSDAATGIEQRQLERMGALSGDARQASQQMQAGVAQQRALDQPLMDTKAGKAGYIGTGILATAPALATPGLNTVAGAALVGGAMGYAQPTVEGESPELNAAVGAGFGAAGQKLGSAVSGYVGRKIAEKTAQKAAERAAMQVRDSTLKAAQEAGYVVPPASVNPTVTNRALEGISGKAATQQSAAFRNQQVTNRLIREDLGLPKNTPITVNSLKNVRTMQGQVYKDIKKSGPITADVDYFYGLAKLTNSADEIASDFPGMNFAGSAEIKALQEGLKRDSFSANSAVEAIKKLREEASANLKWNVEDPSKKALGLAQRDAAEVIEDQLMRHLRKIGEGDLADSFDKARTTIAKTYSVQSALNDATGNVNATKLSAQLRKGKYLSGGIEKAAKFGAAFPKAAREELTSPGVSAVDWIVGLGGPATGNPMTVALPAARMAARGTILSKQYQNLMLPSYLPRLKMLRGLGAGADMFPAASVVTPAYFRQQEAF